MFNPYPKLEFPKYQGTDPNGWLLKVEQYFDFVHVEEEQKIKLAGLHFEGRASVWFHFYQSNRPNLNWKTFQNDLIIRFEDPEARDAQDSFNKLRQVGTVSSYEDSFEELRALVVARNKGLTEDYFVSSFISGPMDHIKTSVRMFRPQLMVDAVFLAKQEEAGQKGQSGAIIKPSFTKPFPGPSLSQKSCHLISSLARVKVRTNKNPSPPCQVWKLWNVAKRANVFIATTPPGV